MSLDAWFQQLTASKAHYCYYVHILVCTYVPFMLLPTAQLHQKYTITVICERTLQNVHIITVMHNVPITVIMTLVTSHNGTAPPPPQLLPQLHQCEPRANAS